MCDRLRVGRENAKRRTSGAFGSGPGRSRTCDLGIKSPLLYRLSYRPPGVGSPLGQRTIEIAAPID